MRTRESIERQIFVFEQMIEKSSAQNKVEYALINKVKKLKEELKTLPSKSWEDHLSR